MVEMCLLVKILLVYGGEYNHVSAGSGHVVMM